MARNNHLLTLLFALWGATESTRTARAILYKNAVDINQDLKFWGFVDFSQLNADSEISLNITVIADGTVTDGKHGFHIHELGNTYGGCGNTKGHYNPHGKTHGGPTDEERHVGDFGNIDIKDGKYSGRLTDTQATLYGQYSVVGRAVVLHSGEDDLGKGSTEASKKTGDAGSRLACGIIAITSAGYDSSSAGPASAIATSIVTPLLLTLFNFLIGY